MGRTLSALTAVQTVLHPAILWNVGRVVLWRTDDQPVHLSLPRHSSGHFRMEPAVLSNGRHYCCFSELYGKVFYNPARYMVYIPSPTL